jgi:hypothetical protein
MPVVFDNSSKTFEVSIRMLDGAVIRGSVNPGNSTSIEGILSKETPFLEFRSQDGQRKFIAKHQIAYVEPVEPLRKPVLISPNDPRYCDAFKLLGLDKNCTFDQAKQAYHAMAKLYHPDVYAGLKLPVEIERYVAEMFRQINTAFTEIRSLLRPAETNVA